MGTLTRAFDAILIAAWLSLLGGAASASEFQTFARKDQVAASDLIALGHVLSVTAAWTPDHSSIQTRSELSIDDVWKGAPVGDRVTIVTPGGTVGNIAAKVDGAAEFTVGEHVLVFLRQSGAAFEPAGMRFGKYEIVGDGSEAAVVGNLPPDVVAAQRFEQVSIRLEDIRTEVAALVGGRRR